MGNWWHIKNWFRVGSNISWKLNFYTLGAFIYLSKPSDFLYKLSEKKHKYVLTYIKKELPDVIEKYRLYKEIEPIPVQKRTIWTLWWQGENNAPPLVRACIKSIRDNANGAEVIVITKDNYKNYVDVPEYILEKKKKDYICFAVLSDIIRLSLLAKYGGLWLDATIYVSKPISKDIFNKTFYSLHTKWEKTSWVQHNAYHIFVIGSQKNGKLVSFTRDMFLEYWKTHDTAIDYLCTDYFFFLAMQEYPEIKEEIDSLDYTSERLYDLVHMLNKPYDEKEFIKLKEDCIFSKLDWHKKYKKEIKGKPTYYNKLVEDVISS